MNKKRFVLFRTLFNEVHMLMPKPSEDMRLDNISQWMVLAYLIENDSKDITQKDIENAIHRSKATVSGILDTLEKRNLIKREVSKSDKRKNVIKIREEVIEKCKPMKKQFFEAAESLLIKDIPNEDLVVFDRVLEQMVENLKEGKKHV